MSENLDKLIDLIGSDGFDFNLNKEFMLSLLHSEKKRDVKNQFLLKKYKIDFERVVRFLDVSVQDVEAKNDELLKVNIELERFAYVVSHDLKAPVRNILAFINIIERELETVKCENIQEYFFFVKKASNTINTLITETLEYSMLNKKSIKIQEVNITEIIDNIKDLLIIEDDNYNVEIDYPNLPVLNANKAMMHKLFQNFIENGIKYNVNKEKKISINFNEEKDFYSFEVKDNGIGISNENCEKIFDMYTRLHNNSEYDGTGIGLAICKKIVNIHNGRIFVDSKKGEGSTFKFSLEKALQDCKYSEVAVDQ